MLLLSWSLFRRWVPVMAAVGLFGSPGWCAEGPDPEQLVTQALGLRRKAEELTAAGKADEARKLMIEAKELKAKARQMRDPEGLQGAPDAERRANLKIKLEELRGRLKERVETGQEQEAAEIRQQMEQLERELRGPQAMTGRPGEGSRGAVRPGPGRPGQAPGAMGPEQRLRHVQVAIDNLHAAGMHEAAERLSQMTQSMRDQKRGEGAPGQRRPEVERLQSELRELREMVEGLRRQVDELSHRAR